MNIKKLVFFIVGTIIIGGLFGFLTMGNMKTYDALIKPPLTPPGILFPIVWTILFTLMGISLYIVSNEKYKDKEKAYKIYVVQLIVNSIWTLLFFGLNLRLIAFIWLILLIVLVIKMIIEFYKINKVSAYLQIPYILWITFAAYLNFALYILNK